MNVDYLPYFKKLNFTKYGDTKLYLFEEVLEYLIKNVDSDYYAYITYIDGYDIFIDGENKNVSYRLFESIGPVWINYKVFDDFNNYIKYERRKYNISQL